MKIKLTGNLAFCLVLITVMFLGVFFVSSSAKAAGLTGTVLRLDRMTAGATPSGTACARVTTTGLTEARVKLVFPSGFVMASPSTFTITTAPMAGWPTTGGTTAPWPGMGTTAMSASGTAVVIAAGNLTTNTDLYCFNFTAAGSTNGSAGNNQIGSIATQDSGGAELEIGQYATALVASDQVVITGTVNPTFSMSLSATTATFASIANVVSDVVSAPTVTIVTNARNGWTSWVRDANNGTLTSASTSSSIPAPGAVGSNYNIDSGSCRTSGCFGLGITTSGGSSNPSAEYTGVSAGYGGSLSSSYRTIASSSAYATSDVITLRPRATASSTQAPATDYTDTITVVAAGSF